MSDTRPVVGFIGLGSQGGPMAERIIRAGFETVVWARRPEALGPYIEAGARAVGSPAELGAAVDVVGLCVVDESDVRDVLFRSEGLAEGLRPGSTLVLHSTTGPQSCVELATTLGARSVDVLDAPVSGGGRAAAAGQLLVMAGGDRAVFDRVLPVLETFGNPVQFLGPLGVGQLAKLLNNVLMTANLALVHDAVDTGAMFGLEAEPLLDVLRSGSARSFAVDVYAGFRRGGFLPPSAQVSGAAKLLRKDADIAATLRADPHEALDRLLEVSGNLLTRLGHPPAGQPAR